MQEDTPEEKHAMEKKWLFERIASLEYGNGELKKTLQEMERTIALQENAAKEMAQRFTIVETAITQIAEHAQRQILFSESAKTSIAELVQEVQKHQNNFREVVRVLQSHEEHILKNGMASEKMVQRINALIQDSQNKNMWIGSLIREKQEQSQVLRQHHLGQQIIAEVIKGMIACQHQFQQPQRTTGTGPTVAEADELNGTDQNFPTGQNPHEGPPNTGTFGVVNEVPQIPTNMEIVEMN